MCFPLKKIGVAAVLLAGITLASFHTKKRMLPVNYSLPQEDTLLMGNWTGTSICQVKNSACQDEQVVFHISRATENNAFRVLADKIVNGTAINMGELDFKRDTSGRTLTCITRNGSWVLVVEKGKIEGTLTTPEKVLFRRISLIKAR